jgi:AcrR family transcriptional regulator
LARTSPENPPKKLVRHEKPDTRFDRRLGEVLQHATTVFYEKGYEGASMRDLSRESGMSLAGLYYYFENKEKLLHMIQRHTFQTVIDRLKERLAGISDPEERMRIFIANHLEYFVHNMKAMKVLSHEADVLRNEAGQEIVAIKREYYRICLATLQHLKRERGVESTSSAGAEGKSSRGAKASTEDRTQVLSLFGMMNWIYTWHNSRTDANAEQLARTMGDLFLQGVLGGSLKSAGQRSSRTKS